VPQPTRLVSCRLELAVSFVRTWLRRACESLVGPLAPALRHRIGGLVRHRWAGAPIGRAPSGDSRIRAKPGS